MKPWFKCVTEEAPRHLWHTGAPHEQPTTVDDIYHYVVDRACPAHDGLPFHNGPDDYQAQEDE